MNIFKVMLGMLLILGTGSCTKERITPGAASLTVINGIVGTVNLRTNFTGTSPIRYSGSKTVFYGLFSPSFNRYVVPGGDCPLGLYHGTDTLADSKPLVLVNMNLPVGSIHTLFLTGTFDAPESLLVKDELPYYAATDSTMGLRFINLSPGSLPISVNLVNEESGSEVSDLAYKERTGFQRYPVRKGQANYVFEFRQTESGELIASYTARGIGNSGATVNTWLYRNFTLALIGMGDGTGPRQVLLIPHSS